MSTCFYIQMYIIITVFPSTCNLLHYRMSNMTKKMALVYVQMMASDENHNFDRVQPWLLSQINHVKLFPDGCDESQVFMYSFIPLY